MNISEALIVKAQSKQWNAKGELALKKSKLFHRQGKLWRLFFGMVMDVDYIKKEKQ